ncbi:carboxylesterase/lipase family protein [Novosphingobium sp. 9]|uniref:carboxylesterase/lipase family protein n=1 Tax=Novosphingobium sp. 9 TaxID=2025349 RepID=UPI0021B6C1A8|nr:carboxylesterase family protein [Novosphingobium sp. 9]
MRSSFLARPLLTALTAFTLLPGAACAKVPSAPVVKVAEGSLKGTTADGVESWKGIPFAAPPVGPLRWRAPQPAATWQGVRDASAYAHDCMQEPFPGDAAPLGTPPAEDCLYANVWRPVAAKGKLPVVVWIYGGGFVNGGASPPTYTGARLAKQGVLFFSFNYRLGRFGTFAHPQLTKADPDHGLLANYGTMDQLAALRWVQRNIAAFGGDPANVTIMGESAGGFSVNTLVTSPMTKGLFQRAVVMSGGDGSTLGDATLSGAEQVGVNFASANGIAPDDPQALAKLRALSAEQVTDGLSMMQLFQPKPGPKTFSSPIVDGKLGVDVKAAYASGAYAHVPVMIGATGADMGGNTGFMIKGAHDIASELASAGVPVYAYRFSYVAQNLDAPGAGHATDIPFFFDTQDLRYGDKTTARDNAMGATISRYLVSFIKTGNPNPSGAATAHLARWAAMAPGKSDIMTFEPDGTAKSGADPLLAAFAAASGKP